MSRAPGIQETAQQVEKFADVVPNKDVANKITALVQHLDEVFGDVEPQVEIIRTGDPDILPPDPSEIMTLSDVLSMLQEAQEWGEVRYYNTVSVGAKEGQSYWAGQVNDATTHAQLTYHENPEGRRHSQTATVQLEYIAGNNPAERVQQHVLWIQIWPLIPNTTSYKLRFIATQPLQESTAG